MLKIKKFDVILNANFVSHSIFFNLSRFLLKIGGNIVKIDIFKVKYFEEFNSSNIFNKNTVYKHRDKWWSVLLNVQYKLLLFFFYILSKYFEFFLFFLFFFFYFFLLGSVWMLVIWSFERYICVTKQPCQKSEQWIF